MKLFAVNGRDTLDSFIDLLYLVLKNNVVVHFLYVNIPTYCHVCNVYDKAQSYELRSNRRRVSKSPEHLMKYN